MHRRTYALSAAALAASGALAAGGIGGASAPRGGATGATGATGPRGFHHDHRFGRGLRFDADAFAVIQDVRKAIAAKAPGIAGPVVDKAVSDGDISQAQGDRLKKVVDDERLSRTDAQALFGDAKVAPVFFEVKAAIAREAPGIAKPIVDKAVDDDKLTRAQGDRLIAASAWRVEGLGLGGGPGFGARRFHHP